MRTYLVAEFDIVVYVKEAGGIGSVVLQIMKSHDGSLAVPFSSPLPGNFEDAEQMAGAVMRAFARAREKFAEPAQWIGCGSAADSEAPA